jgi:hypothetical protein
MKPVFLEKVRAYLRDDAMILGILTEIGYVLFISFISFGICLILQELIR